MSTSTLDTVTVEDLAATPEAVAAPLTDAEMRDMFDMVTQIFAGFKELENVKNNLPAMFESAPPMVRMMLQGFLK